jgi:methionyl-tRNA formyltransferase
MKNLIILGNDKIAGGLSQQISNHESCVVYVDKSTNLSRVLKLLRRRIISPFLLAKMAVCELLRKGVRPSASLPSICNNDELLRAIELYKPDRLVLFRAGLIVNRSVIAKGVPVFNIHAAIVPDYGGIGSIDRAIKDKAYEQFASLHVVTTRIDEGEVIDRVAYRLNPSCSYCQNEGFAYLAAQQLLLKTIRYEQSAEFSPKC